MPKRKIVIIDKSKCTGCGECLPNCPEGALRIVDGKARLVSDVLCDGLGACLGHCPLGAISMEEREAQDYDEEKVKEHIATQGLSVVRAHDEHLKARDARGYLKQTREVLNQQGVKTAHFRGCPGAEPRQLKKTSERSDNTARSGRHASELRQWPVQLALVPPNAPFLEDAELLIAADCVPFACADFHRDFLKGKVLLVACPKLDDREAYSQKIAQIIRCAAVRSLTYVHMEVPCCSELIPVIRKALADAGKEHIPFRDTVVSINGEAEMLSS